MSSEKKRIDYGAIENATVTWGRAYRRAAKLKPKIKEAVGECKNAAAEISKAVYSTGKDEEQAFQQAMYRGELTAAYGIASFALIEARRIVDSGKANDIIYHRVISIWKTRLEMMRTLCTGLKVKDELA